MKLKKKRDEIKIRRGEGMEKKRGDLINFND
jgi:hypothetical protein